MRRCLVRNYNLIIPTLNDGADEFRKLADWIFENLGPDVPLHFTAFHPDFKLRDKPRTSPETLHAARAIALEAGLHYVYEGKHPHRCAHAMPVVRNASRPPLVARRTAK